MELDEFSDGTERIHKDNGNGIVISIGHNKLGEKAFLGVAITFCKAGEKKSIAIVTGENRPRDNNNTMSAATLDIAKLTGARVPLMRKNPLVASPLEGP